MPASFVGVGGGWKAITASFVGIGGVWKPLVAIWVGVNGVWQAVSGQISANASPTSVSAPDGYATTGTTTATASGGSGNYSYQWNLTGGGPSTASAPTSATTAFTQPPPSFGSITSDWVCTVTDNVTGATAQTQTVTATTYSTT